MIAVVRGGVEGSQGTRQGQLCASERRKRKDEKEERKDFQAGRYEGIRRVWINKTEERWWVAGKSPQ